MPKRLSLSPLTAEQALSASFQIKAKPPTHKEMAAAYKKAQAKKKARKNK